jgi:2-methylcitrate dehydratase PrpD
MMHQPPPNYARLCVPYVAAAEILYGGVDPTSFSPERLNDPDVETLARRVTTAEKPHPNPNAFYPQSLTLELVDGTRVERAIPHAWGHPLMPLTPAEREDKFRLCWRLTRDTSPQGEARMEQAIAWLNRLRDAGDVRPLLDLLA